MGSSLLPFQGGGNNWFCREPHKHALKVWSYLMQYFPRSSNCEKFTNWWKDAKWWQKLTWSVRSDKQNSEISNYQQWRHDIANVTDLGYFIWLFCFANYLSIFSCFDNIHRDIHGCIRMGNSNSLLSWHIKRKIIIQFSYCTLQHILWMQVSSNCAVPANNINLFFHT